MKFLETGSFALLGFSAEICVNVCCHPVTIIGLPQLTSPGESSSCCLDAAGTNDISGQST